MATEVVQVSGHIVDNEGAPVPGVLVVLTDPPTNGSLEIRLEGNVTPTDEEGFFSVPSRSGRFLLVALRPGEGPIARKLIDVPKGSGPIDIGTLGPPANGFDIGPDEVPPEPDN